ncbi:MAG: CRISPR-associated protein Cas4 [Anaerolineales bacterium]|nr:CRISPR-associated protein Cas4 [Anaerolineales bacterium]
MGVALNQPLFALALLLLAGLLFWLATRQQRRLGLPGGRLLYEDSGAQRGVEEVLLAEDLGLLGKPDYLVQAKEGLVPVEVKSGRTPNRPFEAHIMQLAAYCALVQRNYDQRPPYGIIRYPQRSFTVPFTAELEAQLLALLAEMRTALAGGEQHRSHQVAARCRACGYLELCPERL